MRLTSDKSVTQAISGDDIKQEEYWPRFKWLRSGSSDPDEILEIKTAEDKLFRKGMPLHLVNVTINETRDPRSQIEQRDRKGIGLAIGPAAISVGVFHHLVIANEEAKLHTEVYPLDGSGEKPYQIFRYHRSPLTGHLEFDGEFLTLGSWTGISGAAFSTSLGWRTSLGLSLLAGLANVRLTYWWNSGVKPFDHCRQEDQDHLQQPSQMAPCQMAL